MEITKDDINKMLTIWLKAYDASDGMNIYNREVCKNLRKADFSISMLQNQISVVKIKGRDPKQTLNEIEQKVFDLYLNLDIESDISRNERLCDDINGIKFLQSYQRGYSEKQTIDMTSNVNLMDVILENTKNRK